jgi:glycosyltransferase involved in cell wall biosynthesis
MRLLFLLTQDLESPAGIGRYFPWARAMARRGHQVSIVAPHADFAQVAQKHFLRDGVQVHYVAQMHVLKRGDQKSYYSTPQLIRLTFLATWRLTRAALSIPADIIQVGKPQPMNGLAGWMAKKLRGRVLFVDCDDLESANNRFGNNWQQRIVNTFERWIPLHADHVTTHTRVLQHQLVHLGIPSEHITYLPHGYDRDRFAHVEQSQVDALRSQLQLHGKPVIVYIGSMSLGSHAVDLLINAFSRVRQVRSEAVLLLVGGGEDFDRLNQMANEMNIGESVIFCGRVPAESAPAYYQLGNVSVDPIPDNASGRASLSLKMFETWACGVPLVTVDVGDRREILGNPQAGLIVRPGNPAALAEGLLQILDHPGLAETLTQRGLARVEAFDWNYHARKMESVYADILARKAEH